MFEPPRRALTSKAELDLTPDLVLHSTSAGGGIGSIALSEVPEPNYFTARRDSPPGFLLFFNLTRQTPIFVETEFCAGR